jgi:hypothetical protein
MRQAVINGPKVYPGASIVVNEDGSQLSLVRLPSSSLLVYWILSSIELRQLTSISSLLSLLFSNRRTSSRPSNELPSPINSLPPKRARPSTTRTLDPHARHQQEGLSTSQGRRHPFAQPTADASQAEYDGSPSQGLDGREDDSNALRQLVSIFRFDSPVEAGDQ